LGRVLFDNLKKTIAYTLTHLLPELVPILLFLAGIICLFLNWIACLKFVKGGFPLGLNSLLLLTIDLITE